MRIELSVRVNAGGSPRHYKRKVKRKKGKLKPDELILTVGCAQIVNGEAVVIIFTPEPSDWVFAFGYDFNPPNNEPKLLYVKRGTVEVQ